MVQPPVPDNFEPAATIWTNAGITTTAINGIISISRNRVKVICRVLTAAHDLPDRPTFFGELLARAFKQTVLAEHLMSSLVKGK